MSEQEHLIEFEIQTKKSLRLFKDWLSEHSFIKFNGDDNIDDILIHFLHLHSFNMDKTFECFESTLVFMKSHPEWFNNPGDSDYLYTKKLNSPLIMLKNCDKNGRRNCIYRFRHFGDDQAPNEIIRNFVLTTFLLTFDPQATTNGFIMIIDFRKVNLLGLARITPITFSEAFKIVRNDAIKTEKIFFFGVSTYIKPVLKLIKSFSSKEVDEKMIVLKNENELSKIMDISVLTEEYGGVATELIDFDDFEHGIRFVKLLNKFSVDLDKIKK